MTLPLTGAGPSAGGGYGSKVLSYSPIAYWIQGEAAGGTAVDQINSPAQDGAYTGVTLGQPGIGDGNTAPFYDGANDYTNIFSAAFDAAFNEDLGSVLVWFRVANVGVWTDGAGRFAVCLGNPAFTEYTVIIKDAFNNRLHYDHRSGGVNHLFNIEGLTSVDWLCTVITWSSAANQTRFYLDGVEQLPAAACAAAAAPGLGNTRTLVGARLTVPIIGPWDGYAAHVAAWDRVLAPAEVADLAVL